MFSKDNDGCIPADELKNVLAHLPGNVSTKNQPPGRIHMSLKCQVNV